jgi:hypothetical protein
MEQEVRLEKQQEHFLNSKEADFSENSTGIETLPKVDGSIQGDKGIHSKSKDTELSDEIMTPEAKDVIDRVYEIPLDLTEKFITWVAAGYKDYNVKQSAIGNFNKVCRDVELAENVLLETGEFTLVDQVWTPEFCLWIFSLIQSAHARYSKLDISPLKSERGVAQLMSLHNPGATGNDQKRNSEIIPGWISLTEAKEIKNYMGGRNEEEFKLMREKSPLYETLLYLTQRILIDSHVENPNIEDLIKLGPIETWTDALANVNNIKKLKKENDDRNKKELEQINQEAFNFLENFYVGGY